MEIQILIRQMEIFASLIVFGVLMQKTGLFSDANIEGIGALLTKFIIPCFMLTTMPNGGSAGEIIHSVSVAAVTVLYIFGMIGASIVISGFLGIKDRAHRNMQALITSFGNAGFIGAPVCAAVFPGEAVAISIYVLIEALICWTAGPILADPHMEIKFSYLKKLISPIIIAVCAGFLLTICNIHPKGFIPWDTLTTIGGTIMYFSSFYIGMKVGRIGVRKLLTDKRILVSSLFKLIVFPLVLYMILSVTNIFTPTVLGVMMIMAATPTPVSATLIGEVAGGDAEYGMAGTLVNSLLCIVTIPMVMHFVGL